ncbi:DUF5677 domain-containing protein [Halobacillus sp. MO56]
MKFLNKAIDEASAAKEVIIKERFAQKEIVMDVQDVVTIAFIEDMAKKAETLKCLIENKSDYIDSISRSIFELSVYLKLLLSEHNKIYGRSYNAFVKYRGYKMYQSVIAENKTGRKIREWLDIDRDKFLNESPINELSEELEQLKKRYADVFELRNENQEWYNLDGKTRNFQQLCIKLGMQADYEIYYRLMSSEVHALDVMNRWKFDPNEISILENFKDTNMHINMATTLLLNTIDAAYTFYGLKARLKTFRTLLSVNYGLEKRRQLYK